MSWTPLEPIIRVVPKVKATIRVTKATGAKLVLSFSEPFFREIGQPRKADAAGGAGEIAGKVRLMFGPKGAFEIGEFGKGGGHISLPIFAGVPDRECDAEPCAVDSASKSELVITLPLERWTKVLPIMRAATPSKPKPAPSEENAAIRIIPYLEAKGHSIAKRGDGLFTLDSQVVSRQRVLDLINSYRGKAGLPKVTLSELAA